MRVLIQKVSEASVEIEQKIAGEIGTGFLILVGVEDEDTSEDVNYMVRKISKMRIFEDEDDKLNLSIDQVDGKILSISQFTLHASTKKGNRPSFTRAGEPKHAEALYNELNEKLRETGLTVETGEFGADMAVKIVNDGPVTIWIDSKDRAY